MKRLALFITTLAVIFITFVSPQDIDVNEIKRRVEEIGKLPFLKTVPVKEIDREYLKKFLDSYYKKEYPNERAEKEEELLRFIGLWNSNKRLNQLRKEILFHQVVAFYDESESKSVYFISFKKGPFYEMNSFALAHELRHAIQDQYLNLGKVLNKWSDFEDRKIAILSFLEGDATLLMLQYAGIDPSAFIEFSERLPLNTLSIIPDSEEIPPILKNTFIFPYFSGLKFVFTLFKDEGWETVNRLFLNPPSSTEQIIHPEKALYKREEPMEIKNFYSPGEGWKLSTSFVSGEFFISNFFKNFNLEENEKFADGWGNDTLYCWKKGDKIFINWSTIWDTRTDALEFFDAMKICAQKYGLKRRENRRYFSIFSEEDRSAFIFISNNRVEFFKSNDKILIEKIFKERKE